MDKFLVFVAVCANVSIVFVVKSAYQWSAVVVKYVIVIENASVVKNVVGMIVIFAVVAQIARDLFVSVVRIVTSMNVNAVKTVTERNVFVVMNVVGKKETMVVIVVLNATNINVNVRSKN